MILSLAWSFYSSVMMFFKRLHYRVNILAHFTPRFPVINPLKTSGSWCFRGCRNGTLAWIGLEVNPLSANPTKWLNTPKQFIGKSRRIVLSVYDHFVGSALCRRIVFSVFDHFVGLVLKGLRTEPLSNEINYGIF